MIPKVDGNLTQDGTYNYTWDAENRLIGVAPASSPVNGDKKLEFKYDYMGRRVRKVVEEHDGSGWVKELDRRYSRTLHQPPVPCRDASQTTAVAFRRVRPAGRSG